MITHGMKITVLDVPPLDLDELNEIDPLIVQIPDPERRNAKEIVDNAISDISTSGNIASNLAQRAVVNANEQDSQGDKGDFGQEEQNRSRLGRTSPIGISRKSVLE